jgi:hypothetical protein
MSDTCSLAIVSDIHYAGAAEQARGHDFEYRDLKNPFLRTLLRTHRHFIWLREPLQQNYLLDKFIERARGFDCVVANGDYSCDSAFCGLSDDAACDSARECLGKLRRVFGDRLHAIFGDHELGKVSFFGGRGGMRLSSWQRALNDISLQPFWKVEIGRYVLVGVVSTLVALPVFQPDMMAAEQKRWEELRADHMERIRSVFHTLNKNQRVLLFCHDPTALPFLAQMTEVSSRFDQIEQTIIGHLHSKLIFWKTQVLAGMPNIGFLGNSVRRMSRALHDATYWKPFKVRLCPALAGIELLKDGGFLTAELELNGATPAKFGFVAVPRG